MAPTPASTMRFCWRWLAKAQQYDLSSLDGAFDRFFSLFVVHNRLYSHMARVLGQPAGGDRKSATRLFARAVGHEVLRTALTEDEGQSDIQRLGQLIDPDGPFYLISTKGTDEPDADRNRDLRRRLECNEAKTKVEAVLEYLYLIRCNMFHGEKDFDNSQLAIIQPATRVLERVVRAGLDKLEVDARRTPHNAI